MRSVQKSECPTRLIPDRAASADGLAFHGGIGPHERIAQALARMILSGEEPGGKVIGIEGTWGAGKTTVLKLAEQLLVPTDLLQVCWFDAWAHERDPLRRSYLESTIRQLMQTKWLAAEKWQSKLDGLAHRRKETRKTSIPEVSTLGKWFALSVMFVPLGAALLARQDYVVQFGGQPNWRVISGLACSLAPLFVLVANVLNVGQKWVRARWWNRVRSRDEKRRDWAFLHSTVVSEERQITVEQPEPTSIEFEDIFCEAMREALACDTNRRLVLVLDNLDRVDPDDALAIWSTLQTFLQHRERGDYGWFNQLWIILPYDRNGLLELWQRRQELERGEPSPDAYSRASSFVDKSFQVRFEVPPLVVSNWKQLLRKLLQEALPEHEREEIDDICRVFDTYRVHAHESPTPRELKLLVNQVGAIHRQWQHEFPLSHVAYYTLLRRNLQREVLRNQLVRGDLPDGKIVALLPQGLSRNLAGLYYNVQASLGEQLLLDRPIRAALEEGETERLTELAKTHGEGFWAVAAHVVTGLMGTGSEAVTNAALALDASGLLASQTRAEARGIARHIGAAASGVNSWMPLSERTAAGIAAVCRIAGDRAVSRQIMGILRKSIEQHSGEPPVASLILPLVTIVKEMKTLGHDGEVQPFQLAVDAEGWYAASSELAKVDRELWPLFRPSATFDELSQHFTEVIRNGVVSDGLLLSMEVTSSAVTDADWSEAARAIEQQLKTIQSIEANVLLGLLRGLCVLRQWGLKEAENATKRLPAYVLHHLHGAPQDKRIATASAVSLLAAEGGLAKPKAVWNSESGYKDLERLLRTQDTSLAEDIVSSLRAEGKLGVLWETLKQRGLDALLADCLMHISKETAPEEFFHSEAVRTHWVVLEEALGQGWEGLLRHLCENDTLIADVEAGKFEEEDTGLYRSILAAIANDRFVQWCTEGLRAVEQARWEEALREESDMLLLLLDLLNDGATPNLGIDYQDALVTYAREVAAGGATPSEDLLNLGSKPLIAALNPESRDVLTDRILTAAIERDGKIAAEFFALFGKQLAAGLNEHPRAPRDVCSPLLREGNMAGLKWLRTTIGESPSVLDRSPDKAGIADFKDRLGKLAAKQDDAEDEMSQLVREMADVLRVRPKPKRKQERSGRREAGREL